jgi:hypothetical protein
MINLKTPPKNIQLSKLQSCNLDWDLEIDGNPYQIIQLEGYYHTYGGKFRENDYYCYDLNIKNPKTNDLIQYDGPSGGVRWNILIKENAYVKNKWNQISIERNIQCIIYRNDKEFYTFRCNCPNYARSKADLFLVQIAEEFPINFFSRDYKKEIIGSKIFYDRVPAIITEYYNFGSITIEPDGYPQFLRPVWLADDEEWGGDNEKIATSMDDKHITWCRKS